MNLRAVAMGGLWGLQPPQCLAEQLTLSQPGGQIMPTTVLQAPPWIFRPCDGPASQFKIATSQLSLGLKLAIAAWQFYLDWLQIESKRKSFEVFWTFLGKYIASTFQFVHITQSALLFKFQATIQAWDENYRMIRRNCTTKREISYYTMGSELMIKNSDTFLLLKADMNSFWSMLQINL